jgi:hypothetical protein
LRFSEHEEYFERAFAQLSHDCGLPWRNNVSLDEVRSLYERELTHGPTDKRYFDEWSPQPDARIEYASFPAWYGDRDEGERIIRSVPIEDSKVRVDRYQPGGSYEQWIEDSTRNTSSREIMEQALGRNIQIHKLQILPRIELR